jgi:hypothetical protein
MLHAHIPLSALYDLRTDPAVNGQDVRHVCETRLEWGVDHGYP